jgi:flagellin-like protein
MTERDSKLDIKALFADDGAVSPVIGVILMVAITVILAAVIGTFVLGLGQSVQKTAPQASFSVDLNDTKQGATITHDGGDAVSNTELYVVSSISFGSADNGSFLVTDKDTWKHVAGDGSTKDVTAGSSVTIGNTSTGFGGETIRVVWQSSESEKSQTLRKFEAPE